MKRKKHQRQATKDTLVAVGAMHASPVGWPESFTAVLAIATLCDGMATGQACQDPYVRNHDTTTGGHRGPRLHHVPYSSLL